MLPAVHPTTTSHHNEDQLPSLSVEDIPNCTALLEQILLSRDTEQIDQQVACCIVAGQQMILLELSSS